MKVKNLLHQPLELDFEKDYVVRLNAKETKEVSDKYKDHPTLTKNKSDLQILAQPKIVKDKVIDKEK